MKKKKAIIYTIVGFVVAAVLLFPIIWMLPAAFKPRAELFGIPNTFFPKDPTLDNFTKVFQMKLNGYGFVRSLFVTLLVATGATALSLAVNTMAGYVFARLNFRGKNVLWIYFLCTMFIPGITILLTSIKVVNMLGMMDTVFVLIIPAASNAYNIFFFRQFYLGIPENIEEAAVVDGASKFKIFYKIFLPMSVTPMVVIGVGVFMGNYNSFLWPTLTIVNQPNLAMVMQVIRLLSSSYASRFGIVIAATVMSLIIPLTVFGVFQKKIIEGIAITGMK